MIDFDGLLANHFVQAALHVIRAGESSPDTQEAYSALYGWKPGNGRVALSLADHPRVATMTKWGWTSAAGAYQAMAAVPDKVKTDTWGDFIKACGPHDFSPRSQDKFAVWCIVRRHAMDFVLAGEVEKFILACNREWASFPEGPYGQGGKTMPELVVVWNRYLGYPASKGQTGPAQEAPAAPEQAPQRPIAPEPSPTPTPTQRSTPVDPLSLSSLTMLAFQTITGVLPKVMDLFKGSSTVAARNVEAVKTIVEAAKGAVGAVNEQDLVEKIRTGDPVVLAKVEEGVKSVYYDLEVKLDGVVAARAAFAQPTTPFYKMAAFWVTILLMIPIYFVTWEVMKDLSPTNHDLRLMVVTAFVSGALFAIIGFWLGTSISSQRKTELDAARAGNPVADTGQ